MSVTENNTNGQEKAPYEVLARKYRPRSFDDLIGHEAMVRTLENAFSARRIAHAYILTGVRGVGKTTTARILARALNYQPKDNDTDSGPQIYMSEEGVHCAAIAQSRHPDVLEMDAASRTGVGDIRDLIEGVRYAPIEARYKVYIIDEVHMLSTAAFNALLKTLEEPPPHVKFIFATTEIRKLPVTVLSRCQRFDLRRIEPETLIAHLGKIAKAERVSVAADGLAMIARAAEGSVRDALSILDQAIVQDGMSEGAGDVSADIIRSMLGLADRSQSWVLLEQCLKGDAAAALASFQEQYNTGADPLVIIRDLLELDHLLTRIKAAGPSAAHHGPAGSADAERAVALANGLSMNALTRAWSLLMKGLDEIRTAPDPAAAGEMALIRLCYASDLPTPDETLRMLKSGNLSPGNRPGPPEKQSSATTPSELNAQADVSHDNTIPFRTPSVVNPEKEPANASVDGLSADGPDKTPEDSVKPKLLSLKDIAALATRKKDARLRTELEAFVHMVKFEPQCITLRLSDRAPGDLTNRLMRQLKIWTGDLWTIVIVDDQAGDATLRDKRDAEVRAHPMVKKAFDLFPDAEIIRVRDPDMMPQILELASEQETDNDTDDEIDDTREAKSP